MHDNDLLQAHQNVAKVQGRIKQYDQTQSSLSAKAKIPIKLQNTGLFFASAFPVFFP